MKRTTLVALAVMCLALPAAAQEMARTLRVTGTGTVEAAPDMATISIGVVAQGETASTAMRQASVTTQALFGVLSEAGIEARDIQTNDISLSPVYESYDRQRDRPPQVVGYRAANAVTVRVRAIDTLGSVLDSVGAAGANQINGIGFGFTDTATMMEEARKRAVADGAARAQLYAEAAGVTLGPLIDLSEPGASAPRPMMRSFDEAQAMESMPVAGGEVAVSATVNLVYAIE